MSTEEIKNILEESLTKNDSGGIEAIAENIIKSRVKTFTSVTLKTINTLERDSNKLSVKDALISIKELSLNKISPFIKTANITGRYPGIYRIIRNIFINQTVGANNYITSNPGSV